MKGAINTALMRATLDSYRKRQIDRPSAERDLARAGIAPNAIAALIEAEPVITEPAKEFVRP